MLPLFKTPSLPNYTASYPVNPQHRLHSYQLCRGHPAVFSEQIVVDSSNTTTGPDGDVQIVALAYLWDLIDFCIFNNCIKSNNKFYDDKTKFLTV